MGLLLLSGGSVLLPPSISYLIVIVYSFSVTMGEPLSAWFLYTLKYPLCELENANSGIGFPLPRVHPVAFGKTGTSGQTGSSPLVQRAVCWR